MVLLYNFHDSLHVFDSFQGKLESYREKSRQGDELNSDQKEAISNYDSVLRNLEFARELQKQFSQIQERVG